MGCFCSDCLIGGAGYSLRKEYKVYGYRTDLKLPGVASRALVAAATRVGVPTGVKAYLREGVWYPLLDGEDVGDVMTVTVRP